MSDAISARRKRGRPKVGSVNIGVRFPPAELAALDAWIAEQPEPKPSRPEAIRSLAAEGIRHMPRRVYVMVEPSAPRTPTMAKTERKPEDRRGG